MKPTRPPLHATRASSAATFAWSGAKTRPKFESEHVEARIVVGQVLDVAQVELDVDAGLLRAPARLLEHRLRDVDRRHVATGARGPDRHLARAGREVEHPLARPDAQPLDELVLHGLRTAPRSARTIPSLQTSLTSVESILSA